MILSSENINTKIRYAAIAAFTLGLAPFRPEPHIWGKIKWIYGGANGMGPMDWFDVALHGTPWIALVYFSALWIIQKVK